jgi:hypothetical protein
MKKFIILAVTLLFVKGCAYAPSTLGFGALVDNSVTPITATAEIKGNKKSEACGNNILGLVVTGDLSIDTAKRNGNITKVATVDSSNFSILGLFTRKCTLVTGS